MTAQDGTGTGLGGGSGDGVGLGSGLGEGVGVGLATSEGVGLVTAVGALPQAASSRTAASAPTPSLTAEYNEGSREHVTNANGNLAPSLLAGFTAHTIP